MRSYTKDSWNQNNNLSLLDNCLREPLTWIETKEKIKDRKASSRKIPQVDPCFWQESQWKNVYKKTIESCYWYKGEVCAKKREGVSIVKKRERRGA